MKKEGSLKQESLWVTKTEAMRLLLPAVLIVSSVSIAIVVALYKGGTNGLALVAITLVLVCSALAFVSAPRRWINVLLYLSTATIALPLYQFPLVAGQTLQVLRLVFMVSIVAWTISYPATRRRVPQFLLYQLLFVGWVCISTVLLSNNFLDALDIVIALAFACLYVLWIPQVVHDEKTLRIFVSGIYTAGAIFILFGVYQYVAWFTGIGRDGYGFVVPFSKEIMGQTITTEAFRQGSLFRVTLPFQSPTHLAPGIVAIMLVTLPLQFVPTDKGRFRFGLMLYNFALLFLLINTASRAAWIGFVIGALVLPVFNPKLWLNKRLWIIAALLFILFISVLILVPSVRDNFLARFNPTATARSDEGHLEFRLLALHLWSQVPAIGIGQSNFVLQTGLAHAHSIYVTVLTELGIVGLSLLLLWLAVTLHTGFKSIRLASSRSYLRAIAIGLFAAAISLVVGNLFQQSFYNAYTWVIFAAMGAVWYIARAEHGARLALRTM